MSVPRFPRRSTRGPSSEKAHQLRPGRDRRQQADPAGVEAQIARHEHDVERRHGRGAQRPHRHAERKCAERAAPPHPALHLSRRNYLMCRSVLRNPAEKPGGCQPQHHHDPENDLVPDRITAQRGDRSACQRDDDHHGDHLQHAAQRHEAAADVDRHQAGDKGRPGWHARLADEGAHRVDDDQDAHRGRAGEEERDGEQGQVRQRLPHAGEVEGDLLRAAEEPDEPPRQRAAADHAQARRRAEQPDLRGRGAHRQRVERHVGRRERHDEDDGQAIQQEQQQPAPAPRLEVRPVEQVIGGASQMAACARRLQIAELDSPPSQAEVADAKLIIRASGMASNDGQGPR